VNQDHLSDSQLQDYLDGNFAENDPVALHLNDCNDCQRALAIYRSLYSAIEKIPEPELSPDFADTVMRVLPEKLPDVEALSQGRFGIRDSMVMFIGAAAVIAAAIFFINPDLFVKAFSGLSVSAKTADIKLLDEVNGWLSNFNFSYVMVIFVILTFAGIGLVDRLISRRRQEHKSVSFLV
jgi:hypothetical protein